MIVIALCTTDPAIITQHFQGKVLKYAVSNVLLRHHFIILTKYALIGWCLCTLLRALFSIHTSFKMLGLSVWDPWLQASLITHSSNTLPRGWLVIVSQARHLPVTTKSNTQCGAETAYFHTHKKFDIYNKQPLGCFLITRRSQRIWVATKLLVVSVQKFVNVDLDPWWAHQRQQCKR